MGKRLLESFSVLAGKGEVTAAYMPDSTLQATIPELRESLARDGYLLLRHLLPVSDVQKARRSLLLALRDDVGLADKGQEIGLINRQDLARSAPLLAVLESHLLFSLMEELMGERAVTPVYKWLRAVGKLEFTGLHMDRVFMGRSPRMLTAWIPLGDIPVAQGPILVCRASHRSRAFERLRSTYGQGLVGKDGTLSGWLTDNGASLRQHVSPYSLDWRTADMQVGDVVILHPEVMHMSAANISSSIRLSCDTRWQPASDARDPRFRLWHTAQGDVEGCDGVKLQER